MPITRQVELIGKKEFATIAFDLEDEAFIVYIATISYNLDVHPSQTAQIVLLKANETLVSISIKYTNFINVFSKDLVDELLEYTKINDYTID